MAACRERQLFPVPLLPFVTFNIQDPSQSGSLWPAHVVWRHRPPELPFRAPGAATPSSPSLFFGFSTFSPQGTPQPVPAAPRPFLQDSGGPASCLTGTLQAETEVEFVSS